MLRRRAEEEKGFLDREKLTCDHDQKEVTPHCGVGECTYICDRVCVTAESETSAGIVRSFSREKERVLDWEHEICLFLFV